MKLTEFEKQKMRTFFLIPTIVFTRRGKSRKKDEFAIGIILFNYGYLWCFE